VEVDGVLDDWEDEEPNTLKNEVLKYGLLASFGRDN
jgi:hypothetical protein